jgi:hypothetical protein
MHYWPRTVSGQLHAPVALPAGKEPRYTLDRRLGGPQSRSGRGGEEKNSHSLPVIQPVAQRYTTELSRLFIKIITKPILVKLHNRCLLPLLDFLDSELNGYQGLFR